jgi:sugar phosphate isomerase/epimerase
MDRVLLATYQHDIAPYCELARRYGVGVEIQVYGYDTDLLDGDWRALVDQHKQVLGNWTEGLAIHGAFYELSPASVDKRIRRVTQERYRLNLEIAAELGARCVVFHTDFMPVVRNPAYRPQWTARQVDFWRGMAEEAAERDVVIVLENMWEPDPDVIADVLRLVDSAYVQACFDVGHFYLFSDYLPLERWIERIEPWLLHCHLNNHRGFYDEHLPLNFPGGVIDYRTEVLPLLRQLPHPPSMSLEMNDLAYMEQSLRYLGF